MNHVDFTALGVVPAHWNFPESQSRPMREKKKFDIERESDGVRLFQNWPANIEAKCLETTLRIPEWHAGREPHDQIENAAGLLASPRLMNPDQFSIEGARTEGKIDISIRNRPNHFRKRRQRQLRVVRQNSVGRHAVIIAHAPAAGASRDNRARRIPGRRVRART